LSNKVDKPKEYAKPAPSNFINKLASLKRKDDPVDFVEPTARSTGFTEKPKEIDQSVQVEHLAHKRDERLALIEDLEPGPYEHNAPTNDLKFNTVEPHSNINLKFVVYFL
jgi:minichromosome maintenance protein 10